MTLGVYVVDSCRRSVGVGTSEGQIRSRTEWSKDACLHLFHAAARREFNTRNQIPAAGYSQRGHACFVCFATACNAHLLRSHCGNEDAIHGEQLVSVSYAAHYDTVMLVHQLVDILNQVRSMFLRR